MSQYTATIKDTGGAIKPPGTSTATLTDSGQADHTVTADVQEMRATVPP